MQNWELSKDGKLLNKINPLTGGVFMDYFPEVVQVIPHEDFTVSVYSFLAYCDMG